MREIDPTQFFASAIVIVFAIGIHEYCHAKFADLAGDPTPRLMGRVSLNPLRHLDPLGTLMILMTVVSGFGIGWGKPVMVNPTKMNNPRWDHFVSVAAGPLSNLLQAVLFALLIKLMGFGDQGSFWFYFMLSGLLVNISLFLFNLIPLGPLDGHWLVGAFLPGRTRDRWYLWNRQIGSFLLLALVLGGQLFPPLDLLGRILMPAAESLMRLLLGRPQ